MVAALKLISHKLCPYVQRAVIALTEKGVAFERIDIDLANKPDWFLKISPLGKTPVLLVGDTAIFECAVILEYLEETQPRPLHPANALVARRASRLDRIRIGHPQRHCGFLCRQGRGHVQGQDDPARSSASRGWRRALPRRHGSTAPILAGGRGVRAGVSLFRCVRRHRRFRHSCRQAEDRALAQATGGAAVGAQRGERGLSGVAA